MAYVSCSECIFCYLGEGPVERYECRQQLAHVSIIDTPPPLDLSLIRAGQSMQVQQQRQVQNVSFFRGVEKDKWGCGLGETAPDS